MAIANIQNINIGLPNESVGSDSLYTAFNKVNNNFATLFSCASPYTTFVGANGVSACANSTTNIVTITNTGVSSLTAGTGIVLSGSNGNVTISSTGGGNGNGGGTVTSVGIIPVSTNRLTVTNSPIVSSGNMSIDLAQSGVTAASYTNPSLTIDTFGRVTSAANGSVVSNVGLTPGSGISITNDTVSSNYQFTVINTGVTSLSAGTGIQLSSGNGAVTITATGGGGGNTPPGGNSGQVQFNNAGAFGGNSSFTYDSANGILSVLQLTSNVTLSNSFISNGGVVDFYSNNANVKLGNSANVHIYGGSSGQVLSTDGAGNLSWVTSSGNGGSPGGSNSQIQYNLNGTFAGSSYMYWDQGQLNVTSAIETPLLYIGNPPSFSGHWMWATFNSQANVYQLATWGASSTPSIDSPGIQLQVNGRQSLTVLADGNINLNINSLNLSPMSAYGAVNAVINSANTINLTSNSHTWSFSNTGNLITSGGIVIDNTGNISNANVITANTFVGNGSNLSNIQGSNVSGAVSFATTANAVAGANVSGTVANATYATTAGTAYSVSAANITGTVNLANYATTANAVALANVSGAGNIASINLSGNSSQVLYGNGAFAAAPSGGLTTFTRSSTWQSSSGAVTVPAVDVPIYVRSACTLIEATILTQGGTGSCVVDIWKTPIGTYPPTSANSICGGNYPSITSGTTLVKTSLTGWTTAVSAGDTIMFHLTSSSTFTYITIQLTFST